MDLEITLRLAPPLAELRIKGEVDLTTADKVGWAVGQAEASGCTLVAVDLGRVTFIDCEGLRVLIEAHHRLNAASAHMLVTGLSPQVARMAKLTRTDALLNAADLALTTC